ncbi:ankyrin repeat domain-containing protein [Dechloromonas sp. HYN0024]|uniref:ankyrin repeat domain-containing protein n=1 Tax=Dechloromonas sp. HYN0024 TaxID=2231055 RepID=UPI000E448158|nr:ankyrin repeat domain-containing protein [Dechloromonas sp. HYN0024]AXS80404.1 ankyrin repeat domain-containing protein [Dechloromonas sp. HYN0024]
MTTKELTTSKLITAIHAGSLHGVINALAAGDDIELPDMHGFGGLPLRTACFAGNLAIVRELLTHGANPNAVTNDGPGGPLRLALRLGYQDIVNLLLEVGAFVPEGVNLPTQTIDILCDALPEDVMPAPPTESKPDNSIDFTPADLPLSADAIDPTDHFGTETKLLSMDLLFLDEHSLDIDTPPAKDKS